MALFWFAFCLLLIFVEITTVNLVSIWFAIGAFFAMVMALFNDVFLLQVIIFHNQYYYFVNYETIS